MRRGLSERLDVAPTPEPQPAEPAKVDEVVTNVEKQQEPANVEEVVENKVRKRHLVGRLTEGTTNEGVQTGKVPEKNTTSITFPLGADGRVSGGR